jgi:hypothetical protein
VLITLQGPSFLSAVRLFQAVTPAGSPAAAAHLGQGEDGDLVLRIVGQVLVQVGEAGRVAAQLIIHHPQLVTRCALPAQTQRKHPRAAQERN